MTRSLPVLALLLALGACNRAETPEPAPEAASAPVSITASVTQTPAVLTAVDLRRVCRAGLAAIHGQAPAAIELTGVSGGIVDTRWRAPVDGGWMTAQCRAGDGLVVWKPLDLPDPLAVRWMDQAGDPVVRYAMRGEEIEITQSLPDGTTLTTAEVVRAEEEVS
jgi:hypothetical protein